jgi:CMP-N-acetylneuraminic acid synthetase
LVQKIAGDLGAEIVIRPQELAQDNTPIESVIIHALHSLNLETTVNDVLTLIQPTSPLRNPKLLAESIQQFIKSGATGAMFGVVDVEHHPAKMLQIDGDLVVPFTKVEDLSASRQTLGRVVRQSGSIYITNLQEFLKLETLFIPPVRWVQVEPPEAIDIDTYEDLDKARHTASKQKSE